MEVRIVDKIEKKYGKIVRFVDGSNIEYIKKKYSEKNLQYKKNDIVFVEQYNGTYKMKRYHTYKSLMKYLCDNKKNRDNINKHLLINKFTNIFNLDKNYLFSGEEKNILETLKINNEVMKNSIEKTFDWLSFKGKINDKLVIGLGNQSVFETSITLHHTYGIPYIPGSAIKGVFKNYIIAKYFKECEEKCGKECKKQCEKSANSDEVFIEIFGGKNKKGENSQGNVIFMDAFPIGGYKLERDVMTPHHKAYFDGLNNKGDIYNSQLPKDYDEPNPIFFLVMGDSNNFEFNIIIDKNIECNISNMNKGKIADALRNKEIKEFILENIIDALNFHGIGAKTSVGYGFFDIDKEKELTKEKELRKKLKAEEEFNKDTFGMNEFEKQLYRISKIKDEDEKKAEIIKIYNDRIDILENVDKIAFATFFMDYLKSKDRWKYKVNKKGNIDKNSERVEKICNILKFQLPDK